MERKRFHNDEETKKQGEVIKKKTQYLPFYAKRPKTSADVKEMIKSDVRPQYEVLGGT